MKTPEPPKFVFPKQVDAPPRFPITKLSNNIVIDSNNVVYEVWDYNRESIYRIKFNMPYLDKF